MSSNKNAVVSLLNINDQNKILDSHVLAKNHHQIKIIFTKVIDVKKINLQYFLPKNMKLTIFCFFIIAKTGNLDFRITTNQLEKNSQFDVNVLSLLYDQAVWNCFCKGIIGKNGHDANCNQNLNTISFSKHTQATNIPILDLQTGKCNAHHGSIIGNFDYDEILYLMSRGFSQSEATIFLVSAFISKITVLLPKNILNQWKQFLKNHKLDSIL